MVLEKTLESPLDCKEIPGISLEGMMLKLKLQYFGHLMQRVDSLEKTLMLEGLEGRRRRGHMAIGRQIVFGCAQSCPTLCNCMDCSLRGSSVHGIFQARVLERGAISFSRGSS